MHLLDDVRLIGSEILALPIVSTFELLCSIDQAHGYELSDSWGALVYKSWNYDQRPSLAENPWKIVILSQVHETRFEESDRSHPQKNVTMLSIGTLMLQ